MDVLTETLAWVNRERTARSLPTLAEMPMGMPAIPWKCPLARALGEDTCVTSHEVTFNWVPGVTTGSAGMRVEALPDFARDFVKRFDCRGYPDLIDPAYVPEDEDDEDDEETE